MAKYLFRGSYTQEGWKGVLEEGGTRRRAVAEKALASVGGKLEAFYFALGSEHFFIIVDLPDNATATAITTAGNVAGAFTINATALLTLEEIDEAMNKSVDFQPPAH